jgi:putative sterol carrier protein
MVKLPAFKDAWVQAFVKAINDNKNYNDAAKTWEGDFLFIVEPEGNLKETISFWVDLWHGNAREGHELKPGETKNAQYVVNGKYNNWILVLSKKLDPIQALMQGKLKLKGDMGKVMRAVKAAQELVVSTTMVETQFY